MIAIKANNQNKPATKKQRFALWLASNKQTDYRLLPITIKEANELLTSLNKKANRAVTTTSQKNSLEKEFTAYMIKHMDKVATATKRALNIESIVTVDTDSIQDKKQAYRFFGLGCAFVTLKYDKRNKRIKAIDELANTLQLSKTFEKAFLSHFDKQTIKYYESIGTPLLALYSQDVSTQQAYFNNAIDFIRSKGITSQVYVHYMYD
jgi:hypothetical protein